MRRSGVTLPEVIIVLVVIGILVSLAVPRFTGMLARERARSALNRFSVDFHYARSLAIRSGNRVEIRFTNSGACTPEARTIAADGWAIVAFADGREVKRTRVDGTCLLTNNDGGVIINSRGLLAPFENRTIRAMGPGFADSLVVNVLGRLRRG